jgi:hypothetical protein
MSRRTVACLIACAGALAACGAEAPTIGRATAPVVNGVADDARNDDVVLIEYDLGDGTAEACTGTLIAHKVVLTARHCVSDVDESSLQTLGERDPARFHVWLGAQPSGPSTALGAKVVHDGSATLVDHDLALLVLDRRVGTTLAPLRLSGATQAGEAVSVIGYGLTELDATLPRTLHARYRRDDLSVAAVGPGTFFTPYDYDLGPAELSIRESICDGDSGGPVKAIASGAVIAVTSRGGNGSAPSSVPYSVCMGTHTINVFTRVDGIAALVRDTLASVGEQPWLEGGATPPPPAPLTAGQSCGARSECADPLDCKANPQGTPVCAQSCRVEACPAGYDCVSDFCFAPTPPAPAPGGGSGCALTADAGASGGRVAVAVALTLVALARAARSRSS